MQLIHLFVISLLLLGLPAEASRLPDFVAKYNIYYGDFHLGDGQYALQHQHDDEYTFSFTSDMSFLIFSDKRWVETLFNYKNKQILPINHIHKRKGTGSDYTQAFDFNAKAKKITVSQDGKRHELDYDASIQDGLSVQLQLMLDLRHNSLKPEYHIFEGKVVDKRQFKFTGKDLVEIDGEKYNCDVYEIVRGENSSRRTRMWFSPSHNYQPLKLAHYAHDKKKFNARLISFKQKETAADKEPLPLAQQAP